MARESLYFRDVVALLYGHFKKHNINSKEYAEYLGKNVAVVRKLIRNGELAGKAVGEREYIIPITSIAQFEVNAGKGENK